MAFPTLAANPIFPIAQRRVDSVIRSGSEGGYQQTRQKFTRIPWIFGPVTYRSLTDADMALLEAFELTVMGGADSFVWPHPKTSTNYTVRFTEPLSFNFNRFDRWDVSFLLEEV